ncbi:Ankyrin repeat-containing protein BDA1 [Camellia lanceoleosa]|uniref:Ankyrin repeat-containing protein BDA1 n=1 Tax=Camellia lanceoleosa TaxID=1840588 RepID=A0ACC0III2_9ERIC|nr:Ankyrin repeat-containing protein BDA1 [Camellia lanceoleosa]
MDMRLIEVTQTGNVESLLELIEEDPLMLHSVALVGAETPLHIAYLAVKNKQSEVLTVLMEHLKDLEKEDVLNNKDERGNTILHLAVASILLGGHIISEAIEEVNCLNNSGITVLDVLLLFRIAKEFQVQQGQRFAKRRDTLLVIAALIATTTYQATLSPPGGVWQDDSGQSSNKDDTSSTKPHIAGESVLASKYVAAYALFYVFKSTGFLA